MLKIDGISNGYPQVLKHVLEHGNTVCPRGMETKEISPFMVQIQNPRDRTFYDEIRNINIGFSIAEWLWIVTGRNDVEMLSFYNSNMKKYSDNGKTFHGAYGRRLITEDCNQFDQVIEKLKSDKDSRQAVMTIFDAKQDFVKTKDVPCTVDFQFFNRNDKLNMIVHMRSNDVYFGFPNDVFNFTMIQEMIAHEIGIDVGTYTHIANSFHLYKEHFEKADLIGEGTKINQHELHFDDYKIFLRELDVFEMSIRYVGDKIDFSSTEYCQRELLLGLYLYARLKRNDYEEVRYQLNENPDSAFNLFFERSLKRRT